MSDIGLYPPTKKLPGSVTLRAIRPADIDSISGQCELVCQGGGTKAMIYLLLTLLLLPAVAQAEEKVVAVPRDQFVKVLAEVKQNKQLLSESGKLLAEYKEMFEKQKAYVETLEGLNENRKQESELLQEQNAALQEQLDAERRRKEDLAWNQKAQWAGLGAAVPTAIVILRKLVFKF